MSANPADGAGLRVTKGYDAEGPKQEAWASPNDIGRAMGVELVTVTTSTLTLSDRHHGLMLDFLGACTLTIPPGLRPDFSCGWSQSGSDPITFSPADGVTLQEPDDHTSSGGQYCFGVLAAWGQDVFRLGGRMA